MSTDIDMTAPIDDVQGIPLWCALNGSKLLELSAVNDFTISGTLVEANGVDYTGTHGGRRGTNGVREWLARARDQVSGALCVSIDSSQAWSSITGGYYARLLYARSLLAGLTANLCMRSSTDLVGLLTCSVTNTLQ